MSEMLVWAIVAGGVVVVAAVVVLLVRRERRAAEARFDTVVRELTRRMDGMVREVHAVVDRSQDDD
jgi:hypothetical protein